MGSLGVEHNWATSLSLFTFRIGEGNGNPLQCSCLENPKDGGAWWAAIYGVSQSWTWLKRLSSSSSSREYRSIIMHKVSRGDGTPTELFKILKDDAVKVLHSICQQIWKPQQWPQDWKRSVFVPIPKKGNARERLNYCTTALTSHARNVMFKILQARLQQYMNWELPDVRAVFRKGRATRDDIANIHWIKEKARKF